MIRCCRCRRKATRNKHRRYGFSASFSYVTGDTRDRKRINPNATTHKHATIYHSQTTNATINPHSAQSKNKRNNQCCGKQNETKQLTWVRTVPQHNNQPSLLLLLSLRNNKLKHNTNTIIASTLQSTAMAIRTRGHCFYRLQESHICKCRRETLYNH